MAKFNSYRRIGNFVIEIQLDERSIGLDTDCIFYYDLPNKNITKSYRLSKTNKEVKININAKYRITGTLGFHLIESNNSEIVIIYARLIYGLSDQLQQYEGVISQIDKRNGNILEHTRSFPDINDMYSHQYTRENEGNEDEN